MSQTLEQIESNALSDLERKHYEEIKDLEDRCERLEDEYETDKAAAGSSKKKWEEAVANLRSLIRRGPNAQGELPFREDWRDVPIRDAITLTAKQLNILEYAGVVNVEDFENLRAGKNKDYPGGLIDLPRVGRATIDQWEDEIVEWWDKNAKSTEQDADESDDD